VLAVFCDLLFQDGLIFISRMIKLTIPLTATPTTIMIAMTVTRWYDYNKIDFIKIPGLVMKF
jgi:hypothetical protein